MAKITDPDYLEQGVEITFDRDLRTISLHDVNEHTDSNIDEDGVTLEALYSFCCEEWRTDTNLVYHSFPILCDTPEQFQTTGDWNISVDSYQYLRDGSIVDGDNMYISNYTTMGDFNLEQTVYRQNDKFHFIKRYIIKHRLG